MQRASSRRTEPEMTTRQPAQLRFRSSKAFITFVVCVALFTDNFLFTMIIPILPNTLSERVGVPPGQLQRWISILVGAYGVTNLSMSPIAGYWADRSATRGFPLFAGLLALTGSTTMYCFGTRPGILVTARALQGASAAIVQVVGLALVADTMGASNVGSTMGWQSIAMFVGAISGPPLAGIVFEQAGHYAVFAMAYAILLLDISLRFVMIEKKTARKWAPDLGGSNYGTLRRNSQSDNANTVTSTPDESSSPPANSDTWDPTTKPSYPHTKKTGLQAWLPASLLLLSSTRVLAALWSTLASSILLTSLESVLPLYLLRLFAWTPAKSGLVFTGLSVSLLLNPYIGRLADKQGPRMLSTIGFSVGTTIYVGFYQITHDTVINKVVFCILLVLLGICLCCIQTPNTVDISVTVEAEEKRHPGRFGDGGGTAQGYAFLNMAFGFGSLIGPLWGGFLIDSLGWRMMCLSFVLLNGLSVGVMVFFSGEGINSSSTIKQSGC